jgi:hypothetical protein
MLNFGKGIFSAYWDDCVILQICRIMSFNLHMLKYYCMLRMNQTWWCFMVS